jgi:predicted  nucleic acid-binding Zn-ribbon protein
MSGQAAILRELHRLRRNATNLRNEIDRLPRQIKAQHAKVARQEEILKEAQEHLKQLKVSAHEKEVSLKATFLLVRKHEDQLNSAGSKKEYDALKTEIANERKRSQQLEDEILEGMTQIEERTGELPGHEANVKSAKQECAAFEATAATRKTDLSMQLTTVEKELQQVEETLNEDIRAQYNRLVAARGEDAMSVVQERNCVACHTSITAQQFNDLLAGRLVSCKACGRILYLPA